MKSLGMRSVNIADLLPFPGNARIHNDKALERSARELGQFRAVLVRKMDDGTMIIVAGNGTVDAFRAKGDGKLRAELIECTDEEAEKFNLADNRLSDLASDDPDLLRPRLEVMEPEDRELLGFDEDYVGRLFTLEEILPEAGDAEVEASDQRWGLIVECTTETEQLHWLEQLRSQGLNVRSIMS
jgi:ParB-like chromosome segregation protein Spo0J